MSARILTRLRVTALLLILAALPGVAPAAADARAGQTLSELYDVALLMDAAVLDFNMLLGEDQSPVYKARLDKTLQNLQDAQKTSAGSLGTAGIDSQTARTIDTRVNAFLKALRENRNTTLSNGAPEGALVDEMMRHRKEARLAIDTVYRTLEKQAGLKADSPLSEARARALMLQQMAALYVESTAAAGGVSYRSHDASEATVDALARDFTSRLSVLASKARGKESSEIVRGIQSKWRFIEKSMLNYHENVVPYLVDRYTQTIVTDLVKLADALERGA
ncbi:MAG: hypothetical protein ACOY33_03630 [Pseudomonadota bacterium]